jgi:two-component system phosphate regulon response regulator PhoB/two-component system alkaline phosphatase synthesis response regulator PhoP
MSGDDIRIPSKTRIALVEDEPDIAGLVSSYLQKNGFTVDVYPAADRFFHGLRKHVPDLLLLDLMLPDADGFEVCKALKKNDAWSRVPIIILTAKAEESDKILGLELGADDYVTKPFSFKELTARIKAVLRRRETSDFARTVEIGGVLHMDLERYETRVGGASVELTSTEFKILAFLASKKGRVLSRDQILDHLWGHEKIVLDRTVDVHIKNIREKLGSAARFIKNIRSVGYKVEE